MSPKKEHAEVIERKLKAFHKDFSITIDPDTNQVKALTPFIILRPGELRALADIIEGTFCSIKRSGTKVNISIG